MNKPETIFYSIGSICIAVIIVVLIWGCVKGCESSNAANVQIKKAAAENGAVVVGESIVGRK